MSTCEAGDGIFKSYLTNISTEHFLNTSTTGLLHSVWWYLITRSGKWSLKKYSLVFLCDLCHNIYHKVTFRPDIFSPDYIWNSIFKIWVWARLVKWADLSVSTSQWSGDCPTCLSACIITGSLEGGTHKSISQPKHLCACTRLRQMSGWQERGID